MTQRSRARDGSTVRRVGLALALAVSLWLVGCERNLSDQRGFRGTGQIQLKDPGAVAALKDLNSIPPAEDPADIESPPASEVFVNVKVLNDLSATEFSRLMQAMSTWIAPEEGCDYCHNPDNLESDEKYPKVVARRMLEMTRRINTEWKAHVGETGVTCWTCHRGQAVPSGDWFMGENPAAPKPVMGNRDGQNRPAPSSAFSALPNDPLTRFLVTGETTATTVGESAVRIQSSTVGPTRANAPSVKSAEMTYSMMLYISGSLGVNCTYCHNTRAFASWQESTPQRVTAWHGLQMVRELNTQFLIPLTPVFPNYRLGPHGDAPKVGCATCHKGAFKPLNGVSPLPDYMALSGVGKVPAGTPTPPEPPEPAALAAPMKR